MIRHSRLAFAAAGFLAFTLSAVTQPTSGTACPRPQSGVSYSNVPYIPTTCWTTDYGLAAADVVQVFGPGPATDSPNMLECPSAPYALCFFSGPDVKTGTNPNNPVLPCVLDASGLAAKCSCVYFPDGVNYVDINGILSQNVWSETVVACGKFGEHCRNLNNSKNCTGSSPTTGDCKIAPVCKYIREQNPNDNSKSLIPGAATISDFSLALKTDYNMVKNTPCPSGKYAGCMTAACSFPGGKTPQKGGIVECNCPVVEGPFQIGQSSTSGPAYSCDLGPKLVWSAAYTINLEKPASP